MYSSGKLENKSKRGIHLFKREKKKHPRQCTCGPAMRVFQSGRCRDQVGDNTRHGVEIIPGPPGGFMCYGGAAYNRINKIN